MNSRMHTAQCIHSTYCESFHWHTMRIPPPGAQERGYAIIIAVALAAFVFRLPPHHVQTIVCRRSLIVAARSIRSHPSCTEIQFRWRCRVPSSHTAHTFQFKWALSSVCDALVFPIKLKAFRHSRAVCIVVPNLEFKAQKSNQMLFHLMPGNCRR